MLKKIIASSTALLTIGTALAGGQGFLNQPMSSNTSSPRFFAEIGAGLNWQNWPSIQDDVIKELPGYDALTPIPTASNITWNNGKNRLTYGLAAGVQIMPYLGIEGGWYNFADTGISGTLTSSNNTYTYTFKGVIQSWVGYMALRITLLHNDDDDLRLIGRLGVAYSHNTFNGSKTQTNGGGTGTDTNSIDTSIWSPLLSIGAVADLTNDVYVAAQILYVVEGSNTFSVTDGAEFKQPSASIGIISLGVQF